MKAKILVIDDNIPLAQTLQWLLEAVGHDVQMATNGVTALEKVRNFIPDIVLSDITMPKIDGYEMCRRMRQDSRFDKTVFIAQTGLSSVTSRRLSSEAGFEFHLVNPLNMKELLAIVERAVSTRDPEGKASLSS